MEQRDETSSEDKTEEASDEKRRQFREEGNLPSSREIVAASTLVFFTIYFYFNSKNLINNLSLSFKRAWTTNPFQIEADKILAVVYYVTAPVLLNICMILVISLIFPLLIGLVFSKFNFTTKKLTFNLEKLNPISGIQRMIGMNSFIETIKIITKFTAILFFIYIILKKEILFSHKYYFYNQYSYIINIGLSLFHLMLSMSVLSIIMGMIDYGINFWKIEKDLKMTKQEVKDDLKRQEGDPLLRSRRRRLAKEYIFRKSLKEVPKANFIITNPEHFSIAIRYVKGMQAPIVIAKGQDFMAFKIREIAKAHDIILVENKPLARTLYKTVKVGQEVPPSLYQSIIEVMKYIYKLRGKSYFERNQQAI